MKIDFDELRQEQLSLQKYINDLSIQENEIQHIAGIDVQHGEKSGVVAYQIFDYKTGEILEENAFEELESFPYEPGFLYYRERDFLETAYREMVIKPDIIACDGNGKFHPLMMGEAMQFGIENNIPTIGIAKHIMQIEGVYEQGDYFYKDNVILAKKVYLNPESKVPMIVSSGYRMDLKLAVKIVKYMQTFSHKTKYSYLIKGADHLCREKQKEVIRR